ncbi:hypothetical protein [Ferrimonas marina]|uniref:Uncharacterized protein n=1 Tax=Ferrimonas marina TaxID=299255 RepID=A0A1M5X7X1_9GAMM|nr:hypothetical protein [Ferrimonas marina]SHH95742.1 hypothetical protein SAMN02745129_3298 [Ferrimonas marina]
MASGITLIPRRSLPGWAWGLVWLCWGLITSMPVLNAHASSMGAWMQLCPLHAGADTRPAEQRPSFLPEVETAASLGELADSDWLQPTCPLASQAVTSPFSLIPPAQYRIPFHPHHSSEAPLSEPPGMGTSRAPPAMTPC